MNKLFNQSQIKELFMEGIKARGIEFKLVSCATQVNKDYEETQMHQAFIVNASSLGFTFAADDDAPARIFKSFIAAVSIYLGKVKVSKEDEAVALVLTDVSGNFKFAGIVEYHENENDDEPGNWSYILTFNEDDLKAVEKVKTVKKFLCGDTAFKAVYDKAAYDVGGIEFQQERYMYESALLVVDTIIQVLDREAKEGEIVDIELPGYFVASVEVNGDEKVFGITPHGSMKLLIKSDVELDK